MQFLLQAASPAAGADSQQGAEKTLYGGSVASLQLTGFATLLMQFTRTGMLREGPAQKVPLGLGQRKGASRYADLFPVLRGNPVEM